MSSLSIIEGIAGSYEAKLKQAGIRSVENLLEVCAMRRDRIEIAEQTGISEKMILKWINFADLMRIKGISGEYSELLEAAGVDSVIELASRVPEHLLAKMTEVNETRKLVRKLPNLDHIKDWIRQASQLPRIIQH